MKCECCGTDEGVDYVIDPYQQDVHDVKDWIYLCPACYYAYCQDI